MKQQFWLTAVPHLDDFAKPILHTFVDGRTTAGPWALMSNVSFITHGVGLGAGKGQKYMKQTDGKWLKIEG